MHLRGKQNAGKQIILYTSVEMSVLSSSTPSGLQKGLFTVPMYSKCNNFHFCEVLSFLLNFLAVCYYTVFLGKKKKKKKAFSIEQRFFNVVRNDNFNTSLCSISFERNAAGLLGGEPSSSRRRAPLFPPLEISSSTAFPFNFSFSR